MSLNDVADYKQFPPQERQVLSLVFNIFPQSVHFQIHINVSHEMQRCKKGNSSKHQEENITGEKGITKELDCL